MGKPTKINNYSIQFNIIPSRGSLQFVMDIFKDNVRLKFGWGMWEDVVSILENIEFEIQPRPKYKSCNELVEILSQSFGIYEDLKKELLKI